MQVDADDFFDAFGLLIPLLTLFIVVSVLVAFDLLIARLWPQARGKRILFDRKYRDRHPAYFILSWCAITLLWLACYAVMHTLMGR